MAAVCDTDTDTDTLYSLTRLWDKANTCARARARAYEDRYSKDMVDKFA